MVACGMRHTLALVQGPSEETAVYAFGSNRRGQLGIEIPQQPQTKGTKNVACISKPQSITTLNSKKLVAISANGDHSAALTGLCFSAREVCTTCGFYLHG
jgi:alpha-tubulin suppressor-like RCC1 family protein